MFFQGSTTTRMRILSNVFVHLRTTTIHRQYTRSNYTNSNILFCSTLTREGRTRPSRGKVGFAHLAALGQIYRVHRSAVAHIARTSILHMFQKSDIRILDKILLLTYIYMLICVLFSKVALSVNVCNSSTYIYTYQVAYLKG